MHRSQLKVQSQIWDLMLYLQALAACSVEGLLDGNGGKHWGQCGGASRITVEVLSRVGLWCDGDEQMHVRSYVCFTEH